MLLEQLLPTPNFRGVDSNGNALSGGKLFTYLAGTTTKQNTYTDSAGGTANANPVILNSRGEANVWLTPGVAYKLVLAPSTDSDPPTNPFWTVDNVTTSAFQFWAGSSTGSANAYAVALPGFLVYATPLSVTYIANFANTGAANLAINGVTAKNQFKPSPTGPIALSGGEIQIGQIVTATYDGTQFQITSPLAKGIPQSRTTFASGSGTYTTPTGATRLVVRMVAGGGGGGGSGAGAGNGGNGGTTSFGTALLTCNGGNGSTGGTALAAGGNSATGGDFNLSGSAGANAAVLANGTGGNGGPGFYGAGSGAGGGASAAGSAGATNTGAGGGGGGGNGGSQAAGGAGAGGQLEKLITTPLTTYAYAVGAAGTAGAGAAGGGAGGSGLIVVDEYYS